MIASMYTAVKYKIQSFLKDNKFIRQKNRNASKLNLLKRELMHQNRIYSKSNRRRLRTPPFELDLDFIICISTSDS